MFEAINHYFIDVFAAFSDSGKRVFILYLFSAAVLALCWLVFLNGKTVASSVSTIFAKHIWWSTSSKVDYKIFLINKVVALLLSPFLVAQLVVATAIFYWLYEQFPSRPILLDGASSGVVAFVFTFCYFILDDFARFYVHRLMHRWPLLWAFHKVHHSADTLTPMTVFRAHPVEMIVFSLRSTFVQAIAIGGFVFFLGDSADLMTVIGANVFVFIFNLMGSNLRHSHIGVYYWKPLEKILISPAQHHIHHSVEKKHWDKNYGVVLAVWDWLFGSHHYSEKYPLTVGLDVDNASPQSSPHTLFSIYFLPFQESAALMASYFNIGYRKMIAWVCSQKNAHYLRKINR